MNNGINLGNEGVPGALALRGNPHFEGIIRGLESQASVHAHNALEAPPELQAAACGYARAVRDVYTALVAAMTNQRVQMVKKPPAIVKE